MTFGQRSNQKSQGQQKSKSTSPGSKSTDTWSRSVLGRVTDRAVEPLTSSYDVSLTWLGRAWHANVEWWCHLMTSAFVLRHVTACSGVWWQVRYPGGACDLVWLPDSQAKWIGGRQGCLGGACGLDPSWESRIFDSACESSSRRCLRVVARAVAVGGQVPRFWSGYAVEHVCLVGFIRRRLDVHRSDRERHELLGCWILTQHRAMVVARCHGV